MEDLEALSQVDIEVSSTRYGTALYRIAAAL